MSGDPRFHKLLKEIGDLHDKKQEDYGTDDDPFANVRQVEQIGIEPWKGSVVRMGDKWKRIQKFTRQGNLANESFEDSLMDMAVYALITVILYREAPEPEPEGSNITVTWASQVARTGRHD